MKNYRIDRKDSFMLMIDIQDRLFVAMKPEIQEILKRNSLILLKSGKEMGIPLIISEQYRKGLGNTIQELREFSDESANLEKLFFNCMKDDELNKAITGINKKTAILLGIESHICVFQTALTLLENGMNVVIASDAVASRRKKDWEIALHALSEAGCLVFPTETIVFMLLEKAGTPEFKVISPLFK